MKRNWQPEELVEYWTLLPDELALLANKTNPNRLGFALLLKFQLEVRFPYYQHEVPKVVVFQIAQQLGISAEYYIQYDWNGRTIKRDRVQIRAFSDFVNLQLGTSRYS